MNKLIILLKNILNHPEFIENNILLNVRKHPDIKIKYLNRLKSEFKKMKTP